MYAKAIRAKKQIKRAVNLNKGNIMGNGINVCMNMSGSRDNGNKR
jgi:hypothetical protein